MARRQAFVSMVDPDQGAKVSSREVRESGSSPQTGPAGQIPPALLIPAFLVLGYLAWRSIWKGMG